MAPPDLTRRNEKTVRAATLIKNQSGFKCNGRNCAQIKYVDTSASGSADQMLRTGRLTTSSTCMVSCTKKGSPYSVRMSEP